MAFPCYLAMTATEMAGSQAIPSHPAWMACHFSPYGTGLSNFPRQLPPGSMLILNDRTPICGHDPSLIRQQLEDAVSAYGCGCVLLDFQRPSIRETARLCAVLAEGLPCPVGISEHYAGETDGPVFLSPVPVDSLPTEHLAPWQGREVWLETAPEATQITVTEVGSTQQPLPALPAGESFTDDRLCCRYRCEVADTEIRFTLWRDASSLDTLTEAAAALGVTKTVGLFQDFKYRLPDGHAKKHPAE